MSLRFKSFKELGRGAWRVASVMPVRMPANSTSLRVSGNGTNSGLTPHDILWDAVVARWPNAQREMENLVPGRRYRADIGFAEQRLVVEVDGFAHHGKFVADFKRDRERQNALTVAGWRILRFAAGDIRKDLMECVAVIEAALTQRSMNDECEGDD